MPHRLLLRYSWRMEVALPPFKGVRIGNIEQHLGPLLDCCFEVPQGQHYLDDFPIWRLNRYGIQGQAFGLFSDQKLIASCCVRIARAHTLEKKIVKIAIIGAVATHPLYRNRRFASTLLPQAIHYATQQKAALAVLWSAAPSLYQRLGFFQFGSQCRLPLSSLPLSYDTHTTCIRSSSELSSGVFQLIQKRGPGLILGEKDQNWYKAHQHVQWYYTGSATSPTAYAGVGRGIDLDGFVHEWGGDPKALHKLLKMLNQKEPHLNLLGHPMLIQNLLQENIPRSPVEPMCLGKWLIPNPKIDPKNFWFWGLDAA